MNMQNRNTSTQLLTDQEHNALLKLERLDIGSYIAYRPTRTCDFVVSLDASPLATLIDTASYGGRIYELMSIRRPGDILYYLYIYFVDIDDDLVKYVQKMVTASCFDEPLKEEVPFYEFDCCFALRGDDTEDFERVWCYHRERSYWKQKLDSLLLLVKDIQRRIREKSDYLLKHEINLIDHGKHRIDYLASIDRFISREVMVSPETNLNKPPFDLICELIKSEKVQSISCPFQDYALWRILVEEQVRRAEITGLPPQQALCLSGPDSGIPYVEVTNWGGEVHIPCEGVVAGDLFIQHGDFFILREQIKMVV